MPKLKNSRSALLGLTVLAITGTIWFGPGVELAHGQTHSGQSVQDHVTLIAASERGASCGSAGFSNKILVRMFPDGTTSPNEFQVPAGRVLVITDVMWTTFGLIFSLDPLTVGRHLGFTVKVGGNVVIASDVPILTTGRPGASAHLVSGVLVGPGTEICPGAFQSATIPSTVNQAVRLDNVIIHGYLIDS